MKKELPSEHNAVVASNGDAVEKAARLAPPEERANRSSNNGGAIVVDTVDLKLPTDFTEREEKPRVLSLDPIAAVLLIFSLAFIAFITYMISIESPPQVTHEASPAVEKQQ